MAKSRKTSSKHVSGAVGGPPTAIGMNYQVRYALSRLLDLISRALASPLTNWTVRMERRAVDENAVTRWDIGIEPDGWLVEVKGNPKRGDIVEWIERSASAGTTKPGQRYLLVYSHGGGTLLKTMRRLTRIAEEAIDDFEFERLVREEALHDVGEVFARLGSSPRSLLVRMRIEQIAEESLISDIERRARGLAGSVAGERLVDRLFRQLSEAVETRGALSIREVIRRTQGEGIELQAPPVVSAEDLSGCAQDAVFLLQNCESGLPTSVLAAAIGCTVEQLEQDLSGLRAEGLVTAQGEILLLQPLPSWLTHPRKHDLLSRLLDELVTYLTSTPDPGVVRSQIQHVLTLSQRCSHSHPQVVASVFPRLDKVLKRLGDKRLVLEIADASIEAAKQPGRTRVQAEAEVRSLICGRAWIQQRVGNIEEAKGAITRALETAEKLGAEINLAFGKKCMGRLYRLDAERFPAGNERNQRLYQSVGLLEDAIECFSRLPEYGPDHPEVGDCYSLLGRTYLAFGRLTEADKAVRQAETRLRDPASKDYLDLQILLGDLEAVRSSYDNADRYYRQVTDREGVNDPERSEMRARAYLQRGRNALRQGHRPAATAYLKRAAEIWHSLGEPKAAAEAELELLNLESPPDDYLQAVQGKPAYVRVEVWKRDEKRRLEAASARNARRNEPPRSYWAQLVRQVEGDAAVNMIEW